MTGRGKDILEPFTQGIWSFHFCMTCWLVSFVEPSDSTSAVLRWSFERTGVWFITSCPKLEAVLAYRPFPAWSSAAEKASCRQRKSCFCRVWAWADSRGSRRWRIQSVQWQEFLPQTAHSAREMQQKQRPLRSGCFCWAVSLQNMWVLVQPFQLFSRYSKNWLCWVDLEGSAGEASWRQGHLGNGTELNLQSKFELSTPNYQEKEKWSWRECKYVEDWTGEGREDVYWIIEHWNGMKWAHSNSQIIWCNNRTAWGLVLLGFKKRSYRLLHHFGWGMNLKIDRTQRKTTWHLRVKVVNRHPSDLFAASCLHFLEVC